MQSFRNSDASPPTAVMHVSAMLTFSASNPWATLTASGGAAGGKHLSPTAELDPLLSLLSTNLTFLARMLAPAPLRRIARAVLVTVNSTLYDSVLRVSFSTQGAAQLNADLEAICAVVDEQIGAGIAAIGLKKCLEGAKLVSLPVRGSKTSTTPSGPGDEDAMEEWDAWAAEDADASAIASAHVNASVNAGTHPPARVPQKAMATRDPGDATNADADADADSNADLGLWEVEKRLFADNQSARDVLEELGLEVLDEKEARRLLRLRVELAG